MPKTTFVPFNEKLDAQPQRCRCDYCGGRVDEHGEPVERNIYNADDVTMRLMTMYFDAPKQAFALAGTMLGIPDSEIAKQASRVGGRTVTRQAIHSLKVDLARKYPDMKPLLFTRKRDTVDKRGCK